MCTQLFDPKVDYIFKNIFGSEKHPKILISFLNACIKGGESCNKLWKNLVWRSNKSHLSEGYDSSAPKDGLIGRNYSRWGFMFNRKVLKYHY